VRILCGTSGFSFAEWKGTFYPGDLPSEKMLGYYAERLDAVEINATFYRMPTEKMLAAWTSEVPDSFRFVLKAPRRITHILRLKDAGDPLSFFLQAASVLGGRLGPLLFQLPPNLKKDVPRLAAFLELVPEGFRAAFEFRHTSWFEEDVYDALRARGAALCLAEDDELETPGVATASWGYLRLRKTEYGEDALHARAAELLARPWEDAYVFFKHEDEGKGPQLAAAFSTLTSRP
jgi:uncharacterized protein YecE (DUF72 family)